jgi:hypothetical protein
MQGGILRKGQVQIQESLFVLIIFAVILLIGLIIFYKFTIAGIKADINSYEDFKFKALIATIPEMNEFRCSLLGQDQECIDLEKIKGFNALDEDYFKEFGYKKIGLEVVYPNENKTYGIYDKKPAKYSNIERVSSLISIYDSSDNKHKIGKLIVERYT